MHCDHRGFHGILIREMSLSPGRSVGILSPASLNVSLHNCSVLGTGNLAFPDIMATDRLHLLLCVQIGDNWSALIAKD